MRECDRDGVGGVGVRRRESKKDTKWMYNNKAIKKHWRAHQQNSRGDINVIHTGSERKKMDTIGGKISGKTNSVPRTHLAASLAGSRRHRRRLRRVEMRGRHGGDRFGQRFRPRGGGGAGALAVDG